MNPEKKLIGITGEIKNRPLDPPDAKIVYPKNGLSAKELLEHLREKLRPGETLSVTLPEGGGVFSTEEVFLAD